MSYGFLSTNNDDEVVIDSVYPSMVTSADTVSLGSSLGTTQIGNSSQNFYQSTITYYNQPSLSSKEILFLPFPVGSCVAIWGNAGFIIVATNAGTYSSMRARSETSSPTGEGMAVFNASGNCVWSSETELGYMLNINRIDVYTGSTSTAPTQTISTNTTHVAVSGSAFWRQQVSATQGAFLSYGIERVSATTVSQRNIFVGGLGPIAGEALTGQPAVSYITARL